MNLHMTRRMLKPTAARPPNHGKHGWHGRHAHEVLSELSSGHDGLSSHEATARLVQHGPNELPQAPGRHPLMRLLAQFDNALIYILLVAALAAMLLGHGLDAAVIAAVVVVNAVVGFVQEGKAQSALAAIRRLVSPHAQVLRDADRQNVPVMELVPGDVVLLEPGDRVPADLRLLRTRSLLIDEALLTGESMAAQKSEALAPLDAPLADRHSMAFSGTLVLAGQGSGVVVATGTGTELGHIGTMLSSVETLATPLLRQMGHFGRRFGLIVVGAGALLFGFAVFVRGWAWVDALMAVVGMAVAVIPEGLPTVITVTLAIGVQRMASRKAVIRRLPAVETLGATTVICSDKTGTLTRNEMMARRVVTARCTLYADGRGYEPQGRLVDTNGQEVDAGALAEAGDLLRCAVLCNDARLHRREGAWTVVGDPMEGALIALTAKARIEAEAVRSEWQRIDEIPFDAAHRFMATLHRHASGEAVAFVKGAPERVLGMAHALGLAERRRWNDALAEAGAQGERVLGFGVKRMPKGHERLHFDDLADGVEWLGLIGFIDPPRDEALAAIAECRAAGITVKMITGDHAATATAIAHQLHLADEPKAATGAELDAVPDAELPAFVQTTTVFARTSPEHKLRIVQALQSTGAVVAMTGDGVNDAPSLKQADVGVAMGIKGTEAAKEAAEMVLLDDNFASIVNAIHEGRTVYDNIRKVIAWTLPTNGGEVLGVMVAILVGFSLPMSAAQILWVNLVTSATLGLALAFEPPEPGVMSRPPRGAGEPLLSRFILWRVVVVSMLFTAITLALFFHARARGLDLESARTLVVNALIAMEVAYLFNVRFLNMRSFTLRGGLGTPAVLAAVGTLAVLQLAFTYLPVMNAWFGTRPLGMSDLLLAVGAGAALMLLLEAEKAVMRRTGRISTPRTGSMVS
jgi:magnesium-transporting ATPase (P-type)